MMIILLTALIIQLSMHHVAAAKVAPLVTTEEMILPKNGQPKADAKECMCIGCHKTFGWFTKRHHCEKCGHWVCDKHSKRKVIFSNGAGKVCDDCFINDFGDSAAGDDCFNHEMRTMTPSSPRMNAADTELPSSSEDSSIPLGRGSPEPIAGLAILGSDPPSKTTASSLHDRATPPPTDPSSGGSVGYGSDTSPSRPRKGFGLNSLMAAAPHVTMPVILEEAKAAAPLPLASSASYAMSRRLAPSPSAAPSARSVETALPIDASESTPLKQAQIKESVPIGDGSKGAAAAAPSPPHGRVTPPGSFEKDHVMPLPHPIYVSPGCPDTVAPPAADLPSDGSDEERISSDAPSSGASPGPTSDVGTPDPVRLSCLADTLPAMPSAVSDTAVIDSLFVLAVSDESSSPSLGTPSPTAPLPKPLSKPESKIAVEPRTKPSTPTPAAPESGDDSGTSTINLSFVFGCLIIGVLQM